jgi:hypothetical protein
MFTGSHAISGKVGVIRLPSLPTATTANIIIIIIIIFINCKWVGTRWQWLFYMYTECDIDYY